MRNVKFGILFPHQWEEINRVEDLGYDSAWTSELALRPAALAAKEVASVDIISGGRVILGVGVGGEYPKEFEAVGVPVRERGARTDEAITVMKRLYTEDNVSFDGRFTKSTGVTLQPKPTQSGGPPIWIAGRSEAAIRRAGRCALSAIRCTISLTSLWGAPIL